MRRVGVMDLHHAARAIAAQPAQERAACAADLRWRAQVADKCVKRLRRAHPHWGDGSLRAAARSLPQCAGGALSRDLREAYTLMLEELAQPLGGNMN